MKAPKGMKEVKENSVFGECEDRKDSGEFEEFEKRNNLKDSEFLFAEIAKKGTGRGIRFIGNLTNPINVAGVLEFLYSLHPEIFLSFVASHTRDLTEIVNSMIENSSKGPH